MTRWGALLLAATLMAACGSSGSDRPATAAGLSFDASTTTLKGATVQTFGEALDAAIASQDSEIRVVLERLKALEADRDALAARVATLEEENQVITKRLEAAESKDPPLVDVLGTEVTGTTLPAATVLATLERLHTDLNALSDLSTSHEELSGRVNVVESDLDALATCPIGTKTVGAFCIDSAPRTADFWDRAVGECGESGGHLCSADEYSFACQTPSTLSGGDGLPLLTSELVMGPGGYAGAAMLFDAADCGIAGDPVDDGLVRPYRCCYHRIAPDAGPPVTPPG
jgi:hypothetical protein